MPAYILKTEPSTYSFDDLTRDKQTVWDGISNPVALKHLRAVKKGDTLLIYHSGEQKSVVGFARAASVAYQDPKVADPKRVVIDIVAGKAMPEPVTLAQFRADAVLKGTDLVRLSRLSVIPLTDDQLARVKKLGGAKEK
jgi:predicted RNA-binding protein with PUA-like domain